MNEGNLRTPLVVFWGMNTKHGSVSDFPCTAIDFLPTFQSIALANRKSDRSSGVSLVNAMQGNPTKVDRLLYWRMKDGGQVARRGRWKVIVAPGAKKIELYDLLEDPTETTDLAAQHPEIVKSFIVKQQAKKTDLRIRGFDKGTRGPPGRPPDATSTARPSRRRCAACSAVGSGARKCSSRGAARPRGCGPRAKHSRGERSARSGWDAKYGRRRAQPWPANYTRRRSPNAVGLLVGR